MLADLNLWSFALSVLALAGTGLLARQFRLRSDSSLAKRLYDEAVALGKQRDSEVALFTAQREAWMLEFQAIADRCDESLDRAETKRRRVAATESRQQAQQAQNTGAEMTREQVIEAARRRTLGAS